MGFSNSSLSAASTTPKSSLPSSIFGSSPDSVGGEDEDQDSPVSESPGAFSIASCDSTTQGESSHSIRISTSVSESGRHCFFPAAQPSRPSNRRRSTGPPSPVSLPHATTAHALPPAVSMVTASRAPPAAPPGVYVSKGEKHTKRHTHTWMVGGKFVQVSVPSATRMAEKVERPRSHRLDECTRPPIPIPGPGRRGL